MNFKNFERKISKLKPDILGLTIYTTTFSSVLETVKRIRNSLPKTLIIGGGPHASISPKECSEILNIDIVVIGEGEITFTDLIKSLKNGQNLAKVNNIAFKKW